MAVAWPVGVPYHANQDIDVTPFRAPTRTDMEDGQARSRRSSTKNVATLQFTVTMSPAEFALFKAWVRDDLVDGTLAFTMKVWTATTFEDRTCSFVGTYRERTTGLVHVVTFVIDVEDY